MLSVDELFERKCLDDALQRSIGLALLILQDSGYFSRSNQEQGLQAKSQGILNPEIPSGSNANFPIETVRAAFPALTRPPEFIFFDNAAGAQVPQIVLDAVNHHLLECNVQRGGRYAKSREVDETILRARQSVADLVNARDASEIAFGMNATSFIRLVSLAIGQTLDQAERDCRNRHGPRGERRHLAGVGTERSESSSGGR